QTRLTKHELSATSFFLFHHSFAILTVRNATNINFYYSSDEISASELCRACEPLRASVSMIYAISLLRLFIYLVFYTSLQCFVCHCSLDGQKSRVLSSLIEKFFTALSRSISFRLALPFFVSFVSSSFLLLCAWHRARC